MERVPLIEKPERLVDILLETEELVKIFVTSIKTPEKKQKQFGIECFFSFDVGRWMFDVRCS